MSYFSNLFLISALSGVTQAVQSSLRATQEELAGSNTGFFPPYRPNPSPGPTTNNLEPIPNSLLIFAGVTLCVIALGAACYCYKPRGSNQPTALPTIRSSLTGLGIPLLQTIPEGSQLSTAAS